mmetsp:Transcript_4523/g.13097  ORF Transcript_4523/g.13097 Transcript_4523/m.13097 type:complete len:206 (+) Transcript_4523:524-1141(+)
MVDGVRYQSDGQEARQTDPQVVPSDAPARLHHERPDKDEGCRRSQVGNRGQQRRHEGRAREQHRDHHSGQTCAGALQDAGAALVGDDQWPGAQQGAEDGGEGGARDDARAARHHAMPKEACDAEQAVLHTYDVRDRNQEHHRGANGQLAYPRRAGQPTRKVHGEGHVEAGPREGEVGGSEVPCSPTRDGDQGDADEKRAIDAGDH